MTDEPATILIVDDREANLLALEAVDLRRERLDLATAVSRAVEIARPLIEAKRQNLAVSVPVGALFVEGDLVRLAQVIANLLQNAAKHTDPGGQIEVDGKRESGEMVIRVRDDGRGISPERLASMFELFVQGDQLPDRSQGGLGIGLTLVRSLVQLHGGTVDAFSKGPGQGSEFVIRLPASSREQPRPPNKGALASSARQRRRILVVDDDVDAAEMLSQALQGAGHEVRQEHDGAAALVAATQFQPDVVLLDLGLPGMDGIEVARRLRSYPQLARVRIVALTGFGQGADRRRSAAVGIESHLVKPVDVDTVMEAIGAAWAKARPEPLA